MMQEPLLTLVQSAALHSVCHLDRLDDRAQFFCPLILPDTQQ